jgi:hypothetical protein
MLATLIAGIGIQNTAVTICIIYFNTEEIIFFQRLYVQHMSYAIL